MKNNKVIHKDGDIEVITELPNPSNSLFYKESDTAFGQALGNLVYPASKSASTNTLTRNYEFSTGTIFPDHENKSLDDYSNAYHMVVFGGNAMKASQTLNGQFWNIAKEGNVHIHVAEMPGVCHTSKGLTQNHTHFVKAGILQVEHLLAKGADPEKIILYGLYSTH